MTDTKDAGVVQATRLALRNLLNACYRADAREELDGEIDGSLLDAASEALDLEFPIIWTGEQVAMLKVRQEDPSQHPYTCGGERGDAMHLAQAEEDGDRDSGVLFPTRRGWKCPACDYRQFWSHETGGPAAFTPPPADQVPCDHVELCERLRLWPGGPGDTLSSNTVSGLMREAADVLSATCKPALQVGEEREGPGPIPSDSLYCRGCKHLKTEKWREPSGDGETFDSGTSARCGAIPDEHGGKSISAYWRERHTAPHWCPFLTPPADGSGK